MKYVSNIFIENKAEKAIIDIEGVIGVPEWWQFDNEEDKVSTYDKFKVKINEIKALKGKVKEIEVNIRSLGGGVNDALLIHDTIRGLDVPVKSNAFGMCASAATIVHQAGDERKMSENGLYLIHRARLGQAGTVHQMNQAAKDLEKVDNLLAGVYANRAKTYDADFYLSLMDKANGEGEWLSADEALQYELIDMKDKPDNMSNEVDLNFYNLPKIKNEKKMKIKEAWQTILNILKVEKDAEITENQLESLNAELANRDTKISSLEASVTEKETKIVETEALVTEKESKVTELTNSITEKDAKITQLEKDLQNVISERDQLKAGKTATKDVEDPDDDSTKSENAKAYEEDAKNFN